MDIQREMKITVAEDAAGAICNLITDGLAKAGRPELELVGVPEEFARDAAGVLNLLADYTANKKQVSAGERVAIGLSRAHLIVQLIKSPTPAPAAPQKAGFFSKLLGGGPQAPLRVVSAEPNASIEESPREAIATLMLERAARMLDAEDGDPEAGRAELQRSLQYLPGDPSRARPSPFQGVIYNVENHLTWYELAQLTEGPESTRLMTEALRRSPDLVAQELGMFADELPRIAEGELEEHARLIIEANTRGDYIVESLGPGPVAILSSPLWIAGDDSDALRKAALLPPRYADLYYTGAGAQALTSKPIAALAAEAVRAHASDPLSLALHLRGARAAWFDPSAPVKSLGLRWEPAFGPLSLAIAHAARAYAAGCTDEEVRASLGLGTDEAAKTSAAEKLAQQQSYEDAWKAEALGEGLS